MPTESITTHISLLGLITKTDEDNHILFSFHKNPKFLKNNTNLFCKSQIVFRKTENNDISFKRKTSKLGSLTVVSELRN